MFPIVTGIMFPRAVAQFTPSATKNIPNGIKNMFATLCSNPIVTNAIIGNQIAKILPMISSDAHAKYTARQTSQLQPIPLMSATSHDNPTFAAATLVAPAAITGSVAIPLMYANT